MTMSLCENCIHKKACIVQFKCDNGHENFSEPEISCDQFLDKKKVLIPPFMPMDFAYYIANDIVCWFQVDEIRWDGEDWVVTDYDCAYRFLASDLYHSAEEARKYLEE
jgi:hypothetical protein